MEQTYKTSNFQPVFCFNHLLVHISLYVCSIRSGKIILIDQNVGNWDRKSLKKRQNLHLGKYLIHIKQRVTRENIKHNYFEEYMYLLYF